MNLSTIKIIIIVGLSYLWLKYIKTGKVYSSDKSLHGKTVLITGGNTGIGKVTAIDLAQRGAKVIIASRNVTKSNAAKQDIIQQTGNANIVVKKLDLADFDNVRAFAKSIEVSEEHLDYLINNAGLNDLPGKTTRGINNIFAINHFGHFLLTNLLLDKIKIHSKLRPVRIINLSSNIHRIGTLNDEAFYKDPNGVIELMLTYASSKLANIYFTSELQKHIEGFDITTYAVHPGTIITELGTHFPEPVGTLVWGVIAPLFFKSTYYGVQTTLYCALDDEVTQYSGDYFVNCDRRELDDFAKNATVGKWLWEESLKITGLK